MDVGPLTFPLHVVRHTYGVAFSRVCQGKKANYLSGS